jgi:glycosyltransferase involved in cell wall biosynthesis
MKTSLVITIKNEEKTLPALLISILDQSILPGEVIIVDGGSQDKSLQIIRRFKKTQLHPSVRLIVNPGNRSVGRNRGIYLAKGEIILATDAGCILDKNWVLNMVKSFYDKTVDVVAGYYRGKADTLFEKCLIPYVLVMPDKIKNETFLPASRSMAFTKKIWKQVGGFPEEYSHNEDYVFARKLKVSKARIIFNKKAIVFWIPQHTWKGSFIMFFRFAFGDAESGIIRPKVILVFLRYSLAVIFICLAYALKSVFFLDLIVLSFFLYVMWSIVKNYKYVKSWKAFFVLPFIQFLSDFAVLSGSLLGRMKL